MTATHSPPEYNVTGQDYTQRSHLRYAGRSLIDIHAHVMLTRPLETKENPSPPLDGGDGLGQPRTMLEVAGTFGITRTYTMCPVEDVPSLQAAFGSLLGVNGPIQKKPDEPDDAAYRLLDRFLELGAEMIKFWAAPRGRDRGLYVDAPWRIEAARRARAAGIRVIMVHVGDPDNWFRKVYTDTAKFGTKPDQYIGLRRLLEMFPDMTWIAAHMGGDPEHPDHLEELLEHYPHLHYDTSATKWQVREVSPRAEAVRALICRHPDRFLFGSDLVSRHGLEREHYVSRYWCQRTLWESDWQGRSPIADPDFEAGPDGLKTPLLHGVALPPDVLDKVYHDNAARLLPNCR